MVADGVRWRRAHILLHEPHAKPDVITCPSARKTLTAARAIVELMYMLSSTNYDVTLLDLQPFVCPSIVRCPVPLTDR